MATYTSEAKIEAIIEKSIDGSSSPTSTELAVWITEVEADADARALATYTLTDQKVDVPTKLQFPPKNTIAWLEAIVGKRWEDVAARIFVPPFIPIVSITKLYRRTSTLTSAEDWDELTEGPGASSDFLIVKKRTRSNQYLGVAIYFYGDAPVSGYNRIKMTYVYGWNLSTDIIGEWCTLKVALKALDVIQRGTTPHGARDYGVDTVRIGLDLESRIVNIKERIKEIEDNYFPKEKLGLALI